MYCFFIIFIQRINRRNIGHAELLQGRVIISGMKFERLIIGLNCTEITHNENMPEKRLDIGSLFVYILTTLKIRGFDTHKMMIKKTLLTLGRWDASLCLRIFKWNGKKVPDRLMSWASRFGNGYLYPVIALIISVFDSSVMKPLFSAGMASAVVEATAYKFVKSRTRRLRPSEVLPQIRNLIKFPDQFSFPSGHAAGAFMMATLLRHFYPALAVPFYVTASVIGVSRVYNGVHYPSDVVAGTALGIASAHIGLNLMV
jgi:undecaprenyl-diphosphatase